MRSVHLGIIAEDSSDVEVISSLVRKLSGRTFSTAHFVGKGCGPLNRKTPGWCKVFEQKGCAAIALVHDLDGNDPLVLRKRLETVLSLARVRNKVVVIPTREMEAWLLSDSMAIRNALNLVRTPKDIHHPETVADPKERLAAVVKSCSKDRGKRYVNSVHNRMIAEHIDTVKLMERCPSFAVLGEFVHAVFR